MPNGHIWCQVNELWDQLVFSTITFQRRDLEQKIESYVSCHPRREASSAYAYFDGKLKLDLMSSYFKDKRSQNRSKCMPADASWRDEHNKSKSKAVKSFLQEAIDKNAMTLCDPAWPWCKSWISKWTMVISIGLDCEDWHGLRDKGSKMWLSRQSIIITVGAPIILSRITS